MDNGGGQRDWHRVLGQLEGDPDAIPWSQRRHLAKAVTEQLAEQGASVAALDLLKMLIDDPKWEVRKEVADSLLFVPEDEFPRLVAKLTQDSNAFVRTSAERALDRRRRGRESIRRKRRGLDQIEDSYSDIEKAHGTAAAERARQMAERLYDVLVGATVHDMRNILAPLKSGITSLSSHVAEGDLDPKLLEKNLTRMAHRAAMLERLLDDMRTYAQPTPADRRRERLIEIVREAHALVLDAFHATGRDCTAVTAVLDVPENLTIDVSHHQIVQAVANLLKNAYEAFALDPQTFGPGRICLEARTVDSERLEVVIRDNGMGLTADELAEVRRFVPGGTSKKTHGTGFGLPIAHRKIKDHGGSLAIESAVDQGTTVTVTLPVEAGGGGE